MDDTPLTPAQMRAELARLRELNAAITRQIEAQQSLIDQLKNQLPEEQNSTNNNNNNSAPAAGGKKSRKQHNRKSKRRYK